MIDAPHPPDAEPPSFLGGEYSAVVESLQLEASLLLQGHLDNSTIPVTLSDKPSAELIGLSGEYPEGESLISYPDGVTAYVINNPYSGTITAVALRMQTPKEGFVAPAMILSSGELRRGSHEHNHPDLVTSYSVYDGMMRETTISPRRARDTRAVTDRETMKYIQDNFFVGLRSEGDDYTESMAQGLKSPTTQGRGVAAVRAVLGVRRK